ncbi:hypothetical protein CEXT_717761 [Caerostris extrusa]|uniref:Uncharacterized protein n=1 Tax=Caerostris extrusa TaxID=172846 RepID=A0AAV4S0S2_CAEEX|nr:hypothetical protein CEXT_717761 [Caerostris extrusa]
MPTKYFHAKSSLRVPSKVKTHIPRVISFPWVRITRNATLFFALSPFTPILQRRQRQRREEIINNVPSRKNYVGKLCGIRQDSNFCVLLRDSDCDPDVRKYLHCVSLFDSPQENVICLAMGAREVGLYSPGNDEEHLLPPASFIPQSYSMYLSHSSTAINHRQQLNLENSCI